MRTVLRIALVISIILIILGGVNSYNNIDFEDWNEARGFLGDTFVNEMIIKDFLVGSQTMVMGLFLFMGVNIISMIEKAFRFRKESESFFTTLKRVVKNYV